MSNEVTITVSVQCPCGGTVHIGLDAQENDCVLHTMPMCEEYQKLDALSYVKWLRLTAEGKLDS